MQRKPKHPMWLPLGFVLLAVNACSPSSPQSSPERVVGAFMERLWRGDTSVSTLLIPADRAAWLADGLAPAATPSSLAHLVNVDSVARLLVPIGDTAAVFIRWRIPDVDSLDRAVDAAVDPGLVGYADSAALATLRKSIERTLPSIMHTDTLWAVRQDGGWWAWTRLAIRREADSLRGRAAFLRRLKEVRATRLHEVARVP